MNNIVLVTGATAGIGEATALQFAAQGHDLIITGRRKERLEQLENRLREFGVAVLSLNFDVRDEQAVNQHLSQLPEAWQAIKILVNNAGLAVGRGTIDQGITDDWNRMIDTNVKGLLYVSKAIIPLLKKQQGGHIINIGSIAGKEAYLGGNVYCATKHAVDALTKAMRIDLLPHNIKVTGICPGAADTEFSLVRYKGDEAQAEKVYQGFTPLYAEDIAEVIYFAATRPVHVNLNDVIIMPTAQANTVHLHKTDA